MADHISISARLREEPDDNGRGRIGAWAPGNYYCTCVRCGEQFQGDKRAMSCKPCALIARYIEQRKEAADEIDRQAAVIATMRSALERCLPFVGEHVAATCRDDFASVDDRLAYDAAEAALSSPPDAWPSAIVELARRYRDRHAPDDIYDALPQSLQSATLKSPQHET